MRGAFHVVLAGALCAWAASATAEDRGRTPAPAFFDADIGFEVAGVISARCSVEQQSRQAAFNDVLDTRVGGNRAVQLDLPFSLSCNSPFKVSITSQNGGLINRATGGAEFRNRLDYSAGLSLPDGRQTRRCDSRDMAVGAEVDDRCVFRFRQRDGASGVSTVKLSVAANSSPLLAGVYADRLTVRVTPLLGGDTD